MPLTLHLSGDSTLDGVARELKNAFNTITINDPQFNFWRQELSNSDSSLFKNPPSYLIVLFSPKLLLESQFTNESLEQILENLKNLKNTQIFFSNFCLHPHLVNRILEGQLLQEEITKLNQKLFIEKNENQNLHILDLQTFIFEHGLSKIYDARYETIGRLYFSPSGAKLLSEYLARYLNALLKPRKKVLVLDLDNTLWGGIVGELGPDKVEIGGEGKGYAHLQFQKQILKLKQSGILLAICSKNDEEIAKNVFSYNPSMLLKLSDFVATRINWLPKSENIKSISEELNLNLDSFVFFDDSAFERDLIKNTYISVDVIDVPSDSSFYCQTLSNYKGFDSLKYTKEDLERSKQYFQENSRKELAKKSMSMEEFYQSLNMVGTLSKVAINSLDRAHQLIKKTNQFNLTSKRYSLQELKNILNDKSYDTFTLHLRDNLGESGIVGLAIIKKEKTKYIIDSFMLSCRVIGRTVEFSLIRKMADDAKKNNVHLLEAEFIKSERNAVAKNFLKDSGFSYDEASKKWLMDLNKAWPPKHYVQIVE